MSQKPWAGAFPILSPEKFPHILASLTLAEPNDRSVLTILGLGAITRHGPNQFRAALRLDDTLIAGIEAMATVYPLRTPLVGDNYYVEYVPEQRMLWLKYQQLSGSRLLIALTDAQTAQFEEAIRRLHPLWQAPPGTAPRTLLDEIGLLSAQGQRIELPPQRLVHYPRIKALIQTAGGRYNRNGFTFASHCDVKALLARLCAGEQPNPKKARQAFFTPQALAAETVGQAAGLLDGLGGKRLLEPSAGEGALADAARAAGAKVIAVENHGPSARILRDKGHEVLEQDFLSLSPADTGLFDAVIANPPFTRGQDIAHITHMWQFLRPGGVLVSLMSPSWRAGRTRAQQAFRAFEENADARIEELPAGAFKASGTNVAVLRIHMVKPATA
jgi:predicted RNA methylase